MRFYKKYNKGDKIGKCEYIEDAGYKLRSAKKYGRLCKFKCECGKEFIALLTNVKRGNTNSCGCYGRKRQLEYSIKHGLSTHPLYGLWQNMKKRCQNTKLPEYKNYGGRGIKVCEEWLKSFESFYNWAIENKWERGLSIDRIDVNGNYEPSNCRLANDSQQARNKRNTLIVEYQGINYCLIDLCEKFEMDYNLIRTRIKKYGWSIDKALHTETRTDKYNKLYSDESRDIKYYTTF